MTVKQKEFLKEFKDLLLKYGAYIGWTCDDCSDTHGLYNDHLYISMFGQKDIDLFDNSIDYDEIDELYKKAEIEIKEQSEEINKMIEKGGFVNIEQVMLNYCGLLSQQKEFIKYLEDEKDRLSGTCDIICVSKFDEADDVLQKYKEIIGGKCEP